MDHSKQILKPVPVIRSCLVCYSLQGGLHRFSSPTCPDGVSFAGYVSCQSLPPVDGSPVLRVLLIDPTPHRSSALLLSVGFAYL